jgi:hypothetical protein
MRYIVKHIDVARATKVCAIVHMLLFLLIGLVYFGVFAIISFVNFATVGGDLVIGGVSIAITLLSLILFPLAGAIYGAILGAVLSFVYNLVADYAGGLLVDLAEAVPKQPIQKQVKQQEIQQ